MGASTPEIFNCCVGTIIKGNPDAASLIDPTECHVCWNWYVLESVDANVFWFLHGLYKCNGNKMRCFGGTHRPRSAASVHKSLAFSTRRWWWCLYQWEPLFCSASIIAQTKRAITQGKNKTTKGKSKPPKQQQTKPNKISMPSHMNLPPLVNAITRV